MKQVARSRRLDKSICYECNARNPPNAEYCRKCGNDNLRPKAMELDENRK